MTAERVYRWNVGIVCSLLLAALGLASAEPPLLLSAVIPMGYVIAGALSSLPSPSVVTVERTISEPSPRPGEHVDVTVTVTNDGETTMPDVRVVDGVPDDLAVTAGTPRASFALRPGATASFEYTLVATRGEHDFDPPVLGLRSLTATRRRTVRDPPLGPDSLSCRVAIEDAPIQEESTHKVGQLAMDSAGAGLEFHSTRTYRVGDPMSRLDWRRFARTGDLTTVQFREQHAARVLLVVDARSSARTSRAPGRPSGAELAAYAASRTLETLAPTSHRVGVWALGISAVDVPIPVQTGPTGFPWAPVSDDPEQTARARAILEAAAETATTEAASSRTASGMQSLRPAHTDPASGTQLAEHLLKCFPTTSQVILVSPLLDDSVPDAVPHLTADGYRSVVVSPDVTGTTTDGQTVEGIQRTLRATRLRAADVPVIDWRPDEPLQAALTSGLEEVL